MTTGTRALTHIKLALKEFEKMDNKIYGDLEGALSGIYDATEQLLKKNKSPEEVNKTFTVQVKGRIIYRDKITNPDKEFDRLVKIDEEFLTDVSRKYINKRDVIHCLTFSATVKHTLYLEAKKQIKNQGYYMEKWDNVTGMITSINDYPAEKIHLPPETPSLYGYKPEIICKITDPNCA